MDNIIAFYDALFEGVDAQFVSVLINDRPRHISAPHIGAQLLNIATENPSATVFFGLGLVDQPPQRGRGGRADISLTGGTYIDLDIARSEGSKYENRTEDPVSLDQIKSAFDDLGLPLSAIVGTGNGLHGYVFLDQPFAIHTEADRQRIGDVYKGLSAHIREQLLAAHGWKLDNTADLARMARAPGSYNVKDPARPKPVTVEFLDSSLRYSVEQLEAIVPARAASSSTVVVRTIETAGQDTLGDFNAVLAGCQFMRHCVANPEKLTEPEWRVMIGTLNRCQGGRELAHKYSAGHPGYSSAETDRMFDRMRVESGPPTYDYIRSILTSYQAGEDFALYGTARAPISLAYEQPALVHLLADYVFDLATERFVHFRTLSERSEKAFNAENLHLSGIKSPAQDFYRSKHAVKVQKKDYLPGQPRLVEGPEGRVLNVYRPSDLVPAAGDCSTILGHFDLLFPDKKIRENVLDRFAFAAQNPGIKMETALVLYGPQGSGKSTIINWLKEVIGPHNARALPNTMIDSKYGAQKGNILLAIFDEIRGVTKDGVNNLKTLETEETVWVEEKHKPLHQVRTPRMIVMMSNYPDALPLDRDDRRHFVINTPSEIPEKAYFTELYAAAPSELPAFAHFLKTRPIENFDPHEIPLATAAKAEMTKAGMSDLQRAMVSAAEGRVGCFDRDFGTADCVTKALIEDGWPTVMPPHPTTVGSAMSELGFVEMPRRQLSNGLKPRHRVWRNHDQWMRATREEVEAHLAHAPDRESPFTPHLSSNPLEAMTRTG